MSTSTALSLLEPQDVAAQLGIPLRTLYRWRSTGCPSPRAIKVGRHIRFRQVDVDAFIEAQAEPEVA